MLKSDWSKLHKGIPMTFFQSVLSTSHSTLELCASAVVHVYKSKTALPGCYMHFKGQPVLVAAATTTARAI